MNRPKFKYIFEGIEDVVYHYEIYADSDEAAYDKVKWGKPYFQEIVASGGDVRDIKMLSKEEVKWRDDEEEEKNDA